MKDTLQTQLQQQIRKLDSISTAPVILKPLLDMMRLPLAQIKMEKVVELVSYDAAIASQCLRLANSPLYGRRETETVRAATMTLGLERVRSMLLGLCLNQVIPRNKWVLDPNAFWRHSLGCALVAQRMAKNIGYPEMEKAYLAGLIHDLGFLVNSVLYTEQFRECFDRASTSHAPLHLIEAQILGFSHCDSGRMLCEHWGLSKDLTECAASHHALSHQTPPSPLVCIVHLSDLLCRMRHLGYGYEEILGVELGGDAAWEALCINYPELGKMDLIRFTLDIDGAMEEITATVDTVFGPGKMAAPASAS
jgi:HD-like signal output (HDOD) protein